MKKLILPLSIAGGLVAVVFVTAATALAGAFYVLETATADDNNGTFGIL